MHDSMIARVRVAAEAARRGRGAGDLTPEDPRIAAAEWERDAYDGEL